MKSRKHHMWKSEHAPVREPTNQPQVWPFDTLNHGHCNTMWVIPKTNKLKKGKKEKKKKLNEKITLSKVVLNSLRGCQSHCIICDPLPQNPP